jgi:methyltransferase (TIGR00027 family)
MASRLSPRASTTASVVAALRALASGSRGATLVDPGDDVAAALLPAPLRALLRTALTMPAGRTWLAPALARASFGLADHIALRCAFIDHRLRAALDAGCMQVVIVGAGLDSRAHRLQALRAARVFEVDRAALQRVKRERARGLPCCARVLRYVSADLAREPLAARLADAGHDARAPSVLIVEGVLPYLSEPARLALLAQLAQCAAPGSQLLASYVPAGLAWLRIASPVVYPALWAVGEPLLGALAPAALERELRDAGFALCSDTDTRDWARQLCPGATREPLAVYERLAVARRT